MLFALWAAQFLMSGLEKPIDPTMAHSSLAQWMANAVALTPEWIEQVAHGTKIVVTALYFIWSAVVVLECVIRRKGLEAITSFPRLMREHW